MKRQNLCCATAAVVGIALLVAHGPALAQVKEVKLEDRKVEYVFSFAFGSKGKDNGQFDTPMGVAVAPSGQILVADTGNDRVQVFAGSGKFLSAFGGSFAILLAKDVGKGEGKFWFPQGLAVSSSGEIIVVEALNHRVQVFDGTGKFLRLFGNRGRGNGNFDVPNGVAIGVDNIVVADGKNGRIQVLTKEGKFVDQFGNEGFGDGQFCILSGVAITSSQQYVVLDNDRIQVFDKAGKFQRKFGGGLDGKREPWEPGGSFANGVAVGPSDRVIVSYMGKFTGIRVFDLDGTLLAEFGSKGEGNGQFNEPAGVAVDGAGNIFVADKGNNRVQVLKPVGKAATR